MMNPASKAWLYSLAATFIGGGAHSGGTWALSYLANSAGASVPVPDWRNLLIAFVMGGVISAFAYLQRSPLPEIGTDEKPPAKTE